MTASDKIALGSLGVAGLSLLVSGASLILMSLSDRRNSRRAAEALTKAEQANSIAGGAAELSTHAAISAARKNIHEIAIKISEHTKGEHRSKLDAAGKRVLVAMEEIYISAIEDLLNAYEVACGLYIDGKIDKERFKKHYHDEINKICTDESNVYIETMKRPPVSKFRAIWKVYDDWHNLEK